jgi:shikimate kinase
MTETAGRPGLPRQVVLVGLMGSGKTTVGAALAAALGRPHRDSDADLGRTTGRTAREIAAEDGIGRLHELELGVLLDALESETPSVISAAASVIDHPAGRAALRGPDVHVVWLRARREVLARRAAGGAAGAAAAETRRGGSGHRPDRGPAAELAARRDPLYAAVADRTIDIERRSIEQIVAAVLG